MWKGELAKVTSYLLAGLFLLVCGAILATTLLVGLFLFSQAAQAAIQAASQDNQACLACHGNRNLSVEKDGKKISLYLNAEEYQKGAHARLNCTSCHSSLGGIPHQRPVYGKALLQEATANCATCHQGVALQFKESAHSPNVGCVACHGDLHQPVPADQPNSPVARANLNNTCASCHAGQVKESYEQSFHGIAYRFGYTKVPGCVDCHGSHEILASTSPGSRTNPALLGQTCSKCHGGDAASGNWAVGKEHVTKENRAEAFPLWLTWKLFLALILFDILKDGGLTILELFRQLRRLLARRAGKATGHDLRA